ncbi:glycosyltransferase [Empedobacter falsenii]
MQKKRIFITTHTLRLGGVERSLIGLLNTIDYNRFEVDLFLFLHDGEMMPYIPKDVNLLPENKTYAGLISSVKDNLKWGNLNLLFAKQKAKSKAKKFIKENNIQAQNLVYDNYLQKYSLKHLPTITDQTYDLAISFLTPHYVTAHKVNAQNKIAWIHTDYSFFEFDKKAELEMWSAHDYIASISDNCTEGFLKQFPELAPKIVLIENVLDTEFLKAQADEFSVEDKMPTNAGEFKFLSVGRFTHAKNFDNVPEICKHLLDEGFQIKWYLLGYGGEETKIRASIQEHGMEEHVIILGKKDNPYPYMKACDVYLQPSRFEGKAVTVREAQALHKPVIITNFATSNSQLENGIDGVIVPMENQSCAKGIKNVLENEQLREELSRNCSERDYSNQSEINKLYALIE